MTGLILKDIMTLKKAFKSYFLMFVAYLAIDMVSGQSSLTTAITFIIATLIPVATISYDERSKWDKFVNTMPFSRREIVYSKYLLGLGLLAVTLSVTFVRNRMPFADRVAVTVSSGLMCLIYQAVLIPVLFKYGSEKGRIIMMMIMLLPFVRLGVAAKTVDFKSMNIGRFLDENIFAVVAATIISTAVIYALSVVLSVKIYSAKEF